MAKEQLIIKCEEDMSFNMVVKYVFKNMPYNAKLVVASTQEAIVEQDAIMLKNYSEGTHYLNEAKLNMWGNVKAPRYTNTDFVIYFVNKDINMRIKWGTPQTFVTKDEILGIPVELGACGELQVKVINARMLISKLGMINDTYNINDFKDFFRSKIAMYIKNVISSTMKEKKVGFFDVSSILVDISSNMKAELSKALDSFGIHLSDFIVETIVLEEGMKKIINEAHAKKAVLNIYDTTYEQEEKRALKKLAIVNHVDIDVDEYKYCSKCGERVLDDAQFCGKCGAQLKNITCKGCHKPLNPEDKFCPYCGRKAGK